MAVDAQAERRHFLSQFEALADAEYRAGMARVYGVRVPRLREMARTWQRAHKEIDLAALVPLIDALWAGDSREERVLAVHLLTRYKRLIPGLDWAHFDRWRPRLDDWEPTDGLASWVLAPWLMADREARLPHLRALIADEHLWSRRLALVATVPINRKPDGGTIPDLTLDLVERVKHERERMITKAVSWALRELTKTHPRRVEAYLAQNLDALAAPVVREVENKLRTGLKSGRAV
jgi:3-methyladenine DNA glycosylase AlkD